MFKQKEKATPQNVKVFVQDKQAKETSTFLAMLLMISAIGIIITLVLSVITVVTDTDECVQFQLVDCHWDTVVDTDNNTIEVSLYEKGNLIATVAGELVAINEYLPGEMAWMAFADTHEDFRGRGIAPHNANMFDDLIVKHYGTQKRVFLNVSEMKGFGEKMETKLRATYEVIYDNDGVIVYIIP